MRPSVAGWFDLVDPVELAKAFSRLKIVLKKKDLMKIIEVLDRDKDFNITFSEWQTYFRFAPSTELEASLRSWRRGVQLDTINEQQMPNSYTEKERENGFYSRHFIAGALSGMVSRTVTAPLDRLKIYMQAMGKKKLLNTATYGPVSWTGAARSNAVCLGPCTERVEVV